MELKGVEEGAKKEAALLRQLFDLEVKGRSGQNIVVARLNPDPMRVEAIKNFSITPQDARNLRDRMQKQVNKLDEVIKFLDKENGLI